jgi:trans-aconitate methyltransferase
MIDDLDREAIVRRYTDRFATFGVDVRSLASGTEERHRLQHAVHASAGDPNGKVVLDLGCGLAHYYEFLRARGADVRYIGYDIVPAFIESNRARHPEAEFELRDVTRDGIAHEADFVVMCEVFNGRYEHASNVEVVQRVLREAFAAARVAVSIDLLSTYVDYQTPNAFHYSPEEMFAYAKSLTRFVALRHDYLPFHFTMFLFKNVR